MLLVERWFRRLPLGSKLNAITMAIGGTSMALAALVFGTYEAATTGNRLARDLRAHWAFMADEPAAAVALGDSMAVAQALRSVTPNEDIASVRIELPDGRIFARFDRAAPAATAALIGNPATSFA